MSSLPSSFIMETLKDRIKETSNHEATKREAKKQYGNVSVQIRDNNCFLNPKVFPLNDRNNKVKNNKYPSYCELLNFDPERYPLPSVMNPEDKSNKMEISPSGLEVKYVGPGRSDSDAAAIRSNLPVPAQVGIYYFEVKVTNKGRDGYIAVGYAIKSASLGRLTGWEPGTIGYHADDGNLYRGAGTGTSYGPSYTTNDIVGCGINFVEKSFFFTKNGILIGEIGNLKDKFHLPFFPSVGCRTVGEVLSINFGINNANHQQQFSFDISNFIRKKLRNHFEFPQGLKEYDLILSYLIHCGYKEAARAFLKETHSTSDVFEGQLEIEESFKIAQNRRLVIEAIKSGNMLELGEIFRKNFPSFLMENTSIAFKLECLNFIELIRLNEISQTGDKLSEIIENGRRLTGQFPPNIIESNSKLLQDTLALLAYSQPSQCPVAYLLQKPFKIKLAEEIDLALLAHEGKSPLSPLHQVLRQSQVVMDELQYMEDPEISIINL